MTEKFVVTGMTCAACAAHVEKAASSVPGVENAAVNLMLGTLVCDHGPEVDSSGLRRCAGERGPAGHPQGAGRGG